jgi:hypothetical protein
MKCDVKGILRVIAVGVGPEGLAEQFGMHVPPAESDERL